MLCFVSCNCQTLFKFYFFHSVAKLDDKTVRKSVKGRRLVKMRGMREREDIAGKKKKRTRHASGERGVK